MSYPVHVADRIVSVDIVGRRPDLRVIVDGRAMSVMEHDAASGEFEVRIEGEVLRGYRYVAGDQVYVRLHGRTFVVELPRNESGSTGGEQGRDDLRADMPGVVVAVHCAAGRDVKAGDKLVTLESMKLQISLVAHRDGTVEKVHRAPNETFERGALLVSLKKDAQT